MKIAIELSEELYRYIIGETYDEHLDRRFDFMIRHAVKNGEVLNDESSSMSGSRTNADCIRQIADDEELLSAIGTGCFRCAYNDDECDSGYGKGCVAGNLEWLRQEVPNNE